MLRSGRKKSARACLILHGIVVGHVAKQLCNLPHDVVVLMAQERDKGSGTALVNKLGVQLRGGCVGHRCQDQEHNKFTPKRTRQNLVRVEGCKQVHFAFHKLFWLVGVLETSREVVLGLCMPQGLSHNTQASLNQSHLALQLQDESFEGFCVEELHLLSGLLLCCLQELFSSGQAAARLGRLISAACVWGMRRGGLPGIAVVAHAFWAAGEEVAGFCAIKASSRHKLWEVQGWLIVTSKLADSSLQHRGWGCHGRVWWAGRQSDESADPPEGQRMSYWLPVCYCQHAGGHEVQHAI